MTLHQQIIWSAALAFTIFGSILSQQACAEEPKGLATIRHLDHTILLCSDLEKTRAFYSETMGFEIYRDLPNWIELKVGSSLLTLRPHGRDYDGPSISTKSAKVQLAFRVHPEEVKSAERALRQAGVRILDPTTDQAWGHRTLFFKDPEGNILEIYADI